MGVGGQGVVVIEVEVEMEMDGGWDLVEFNDVLLLLKER